LLSRPTDRCCLSNVSIDHLLSFTQSLLVLIAKAADILDWVAVEPLPETAETIGGACWAAPQDQLVIVNLDGEPFARLDAQLLPRHAAGRSVLLLTLTLSRRMISGNGLPLAAVRSARQAATLPFGRRWTRAHHGPISHLELNAKEPSIERMAQPLASRPAGGPFGGDRLRRRPIPAGLRLQIDDRALEPPCHPVAVLERNRSAEPGMFLTA
jgi:hypothetical protein